MSDVHRRNVLLGTLGGVVVGSAAGIFSGLSQRSESHTKKYGILSYAQQGEDLVIAQIFGSLRLGLPSYVDIGAHHPIENNNTFFFYAQGARGLLVEPNPTYAALLRRLRPLDTVLEAGIGFDEGVVQADYWVVKGDGQLNTFSKEQADAIVRRAGPNAIERVVKLPLVNVNAALAKHFPQGGPTLLSVDTEGLDLDILKALDFGRFRPKVVCAETCGMDGLVLQPILDLMQSHGYTPRGGSFVNTIFLDNALVNHA
jgi:Methyltransferase FkbM domain